MRWTRWVTILSKDIFGWSILKFKVYHAQLHAPQLYFLSCWKFTKRYVTSYACDRTCDTADVHMWRWSWDVHHVTSSLHYWIRTNVEGTISEYQKSHIDTIPKDSLRIGQFRLIDVKSMLVTDVKDHSRWWHTYLRFWWPFFSLKKSPAWRKKSLTY